MPRVFALRALVAALVSSAALFSQGAIRYVPSGYPTIQSAIDAARSGDEVRIAAGTYHEAIDFLGKAIRVIGAGTELTILDGAGLTRSVVTFRSGETNASVLQDVAVVGGTSGTLDAASGWNYGGAVFCDGSAPLLRRCRFEGNRVPLPGGLGGAIGAKSTPGLVLEACRLAANVAAGSGGGLHVQTGAVVRINGCWFERNDATTAGGGVAMNSGDLLVHATRFVGNRAGIGLSSGTARGGGAFVNGNVVMTACRLVSNTSTHNGGGLWIQGILDLSGSRFERNAGLGGALGVGGVSRIDRCVFASNTSTSRHVYGNAATLSIGGAATVTRSVFRSNAAGHFGAVVNACSGCSNSYNGWPGPTSTAVLVNCIVEGNYGGFTLYEGNVQVTYSCGQVPAGVGNLVGIDARFRSANAEDLRLQPTSPCIDAGDPLSPNDPDGTRADMGAHAHTALPSPLHSFIDGSMKVSTLSGGLGAGLDAGDRFGRSLANLGDLNGDGIDDLVVGALYDDDGGPNRGAVWIVFPRADGTVLARQKISSTQGGFGVGIWAYHEFGCSVAGLGDLNADGIGDLAVGAHQDDEGGSWDDNHGAVWVIFLNADGTVRGKQKISAVQGGFAATLDVEDRFGSTVCCPGDIDGDSIPDLAVAARGDDDGGPNRGAIYLLFLRRDGTVRAQQKISSTSGSFEGPLRDGDEFGCWSIAGLGDLDGNGVPDLAAQAYLDDDGAANTGAIWILHLASDGTVIGERKLSATSGHFGGALWSGDSFGQGLASLGHPSSPGGLHLLVGAPGDDDGGTDRGGVWLLSLDADYRVRMEHKISAYGGGLGTALDDGDQFGSSLCLVRDRDGDGRPEIVVGAPGDDDGQVDAGSIYGLTSIDGFLPWDGEGRGLAGIAGEPLLRGKGELIGGIPARWQLSRAYPGAPVLLIVGDFAIHLPFLGGDLVPFPGMSFFAGVVDAWGEWFFDLAVPPGAPPGLDLYWQCWIPDPYAPQGYSASNGLRSTTR